MSKLNVKRGDDFDEKQEKGMTKRHYEDCNRRAEQEQKA
jgi:hypothetical protein